MCCCSAALEATLFPAAVKCFGLSGSGDALLHMGDAEHGEHAVTAGERYVLGLHLGHDALR